MHALNETLTLLTDWMGRRNGALPTSIRTKLAADLGELTRKLDTALPEERMETRAVTHRPALLLETVSQPPSDPVGMDERVRQFEANIAPRLDEMTRRLDRLAQRLDPLDVGSIGDRLAFITGQLAEVLRIGSEEHGDLLRKVDVLSERVDDVRVCVPSQNAALSDLRDLLNELGNKIGQTVDDGSERHRGILEAVRLGLLEVKASNAASDEQVRATLRELENQIRVLRLPADRQKLVSETVEGADSRSVGRLTAAVRHMQHQSTGTEGPSANLRAPASSLVVPTEASAARNDLRTQLIAAARRASEPDTKAERDDSVSKAVLSKEPPADPLEDLRLKAMATENRSRKTKAASESSDANTSLEERINLLKLVKRSLGARWSA